MSNGAIRSAGALLVGAGAAAALLPRALGLAAGDPLHSTVQMVPLVVGGLYLVERRAATQGMRLLPRKALAAQAVAALGWLLLAAARARLDLPLAPALAAALFALLGVHLLMLLPRLLPLLAGVEDQRAASAATDARTRASATFFWLPLLAYLAVLPWCTEQRPPDGDEPYYLLVAHSIAYDGDADLANQYAHGDSLAFMARRVEPQPGDPVGPDGERYSRHNVVLPLLLALPYRLAGARGAFLTMAALTAALAWQTLRLMRHRFPAAHGGALLAWALLAFSPPLLLYSHQVWVEVPAAILLGVAVDALAVRRRAGLRFWSAVALLPLLKLRFAVLAALLALLAWWRGGRRLRLLLPIGAGLLLLFGTILLFNELRFGSALKTYGLEQLLPESGPMVVLARLLGLFFDAAFGLFGVAPLWALLLPAFVLALRRREPLLADIALLVLPYLVLVAFRREWYGGWSPPFRYGVPVLPVLALLLVPLLERRRHAGARLLTGALGGLTVMLSLLWVAVPGWTYNFADGGTLLADALGRELQLDVARLLPSAARLRAASWWWPPVALLIVVALWWLERRPQRGWVRAGVALALLVPAGAVAAAGTLPTHIIEAEDAQVRTVGGILYPPRWTFDRLRYRNGWHLLGESSLAAPVVPGGTRVRLRVFAREEPDERGVATLQVAAGETPLASVVVPPDHWARLDLGPFAWPAGAPLVLAMHQGSAPMVVDRVELAWER